MSDEAIFRAMIEKAKREHDERADAAAAKVAAAASAREEQRKAAVSWLKDTALPVLRKAQAVFKEQGVQLSIVENFEDSHHQIERLHLVIQCSHFPEDDSPTFGGPAAKFFISSDGKTFSMGRMDNHDMPDSEAAKIAVDAADSRALITALVQSAIDDFFTEDERLGR
jgi:hypothetical protein